MVMPSALHVWGHVSLLGSVWRFNKKSARKMDFAVNSGSLEIESGKKTGDSVYKGLYEL